LKIEIGQTVNNSLKPFNLTYDTVGRLLSVTSNNTVINLNWDSQDKVNIVTRKEGSNPTQTIALNYSNNLLVSGTLL